MSTTLYELIDELPECEGLLVSIIVTAQYISFKFSLNGKTNSEYLPLSEHVTYN